MVIIDLFLLTGGDCDNPVSQLSSHFTVNQLRRILLTQFETEPSRGEYNTDYW